MSSETPIQITFSIKRCECILFEITNESAEKTNFDKYTFSFNFRFDLDDVGKLAIIAINSTLASVDSPSALLVKLDSVNEFLVVNFEEAIKRNKEGILSIPDQILANLLSISLSSMRGMYSIKLQDTMFKNAVVPLIDANSLLPKKTMITVG